MIWALIKVIANVLWFLFLITLAAALIWATYTGYQSSEREKAICARLHGELIDLVGPTQGVKKVIYFTNEEKTDVR